MIRAVVTFFFVLFVWSTATLHAQTFTSEITRKKPRQVVKIEPNAKDSSRFFLKSTFAAHPLDSASLGKWLKRYNIVQISLVYTSFKLDSSFDQKQLNANRVNSLLRIFPDLNNNHGIKWELVEQTGCKSAEEGEKYFHGFILKGERRPDESYTRSEINYLKNKFSGVLGLPVTNTTETTTTTVTGGTVTEKKEPGLFKCPEFNGGESALRSYVERNMKSPNVMNEYLFEDYTKVKAFVNAQGELQSPEVVPNAKRWEWSEKEALRLVQGMPKWVAGNSKGITKGAWVEISIYFGKTKKPTIVKCGAPEGTRLEPEPAHLSAKTDSVVYKALDRNKKWNKMVIVCDLTGSMVKHTEMLLFWLKNAYANHSDKIEGVVFFNDGDNMPDKSKKNGKTGGIYTSASKSISEIVDLAIQTMGKGSGGDIRENNVEAILFGIGKFPAGNDIVMIADNPASPRDLDMMGQITKPVHIILCSVMGDINADYLNLARKTKGSIHVGTKDYYNLHDIPNGEIFMIGPNTFTVSGGKIVPAY